MDIASEVACQRYCGNVAVTVSINEVTFSKSIKVGEIVTIHAAVIKTGNTSMEVSVEVWTENIPNKTKQRTNEAKMTFVAVDGQGKPMSVPTILGS